MEMSIAVAGGIMVESSLATDTSEVKVMTLEVLRG